MTSGDLASFSDELKKIAEWDSKKFREGLVDEGIPLAGATIGARYGGLRGAALGYAGGGAASMARSYIKGEKPSMSRKLLAAGALGYGAGGGTHALLEHATKGAKSGKGLLGKIRHAFHPPAGTTTHLSRTVEEALPAAGATLATGIAMGTTGKKAKEKQAMLPVLKAFTKNLGAESKILLPSARKAVTPSRAPSLHANKSNYTPAAASPGATWASRTDPRHGALRRAGGIDLPAAPAGPMVVQRGYYGA